MYPFLIPLVVLFSLSLPPFLYPVLKSIGVYSELWLNLAVLVPASFISAFLITVKDSRTSIPIALSLVLDDIIDFPVAAWSSVYDAAITGQSFLSNASISASSLLLNTAVSIRSSLLNISLSVWSLLLTAQSPLRKLIADVNHLFSFVVVDVHASHFDSDLSVDLPSPSHADVNTDTDVDANTSTGSDTDTIVDTDLDTDTTVKPLSQVLELEAEVERLRTELAEKTRCIEDLEDEVELVASEKNYLNGVIEARCAEFVHLNGVIDKRNREIKTLKAAVAQAHEKCKDLEIEIEILEEGASQRDEEVAQLASIIEQHAETDEKLEAAEREAIKYASEVEEKLRLAEEELDYTRNQNKQLIAWNSTVETRNEDQHGVIAALIAIRGQEDSFKWIAQAVESEALKAEHNREHRNLRTRVSDLTSMNAQLMSRQRTLVRQLPLSTTLGKRRTNPTFEGGPVGLAPFKSARWDPEACNSNSSLCELASLPRDCNEDDMEPLDESSDSLSSSPTCGSLTPSLSSLEDDIAQEPATTEYESSGDLSASAAHLSAPASCFSAPASCLSVSASHLSASVSVFHFPASVSQVSSHISDFGSLIRRLTHRSMSRGSHVTWLSVTEQWSGRIQRQTALFCSSTTSHCTIPTTLSCTEVRSIFIAYYMPGLSPTRRTNQPVASGSKLPEPPTVTLPKTDNEKGKLVQRNEEEHKNVNGASKARKKGGSIPNGSSALTHAANGSVPAGNEQDIDATDADEEDEDGEVEEEEEEYEADRWFTDRSGLQFRYPPQDASDERWLETMAAAVVEGAEDFDRHAAEVRAQLAQRLLEATLLEVEVDEATEEYCEMLVELSDSVGEDAAYEIVKAARNVAVPRYDDVDSEVAFARPRIEIEQATEDGSGDKDEDMVDQSVETTGISSEGPPTSPTSHVVAHRAQKRPRPIEDDHDHDNADDRDPILELFDQAKRRRRAGVASSPGPAKQHRRSHPRSPLPIRTDSPLPPSSPPPSSPDKPAGPRSVPQRFGQFLVPPAAEGQRRSRRSRPPFRLSQIYPSESSDGEGEGEGEADVEEQEKVFERPPNPEPPSPTDTEPAGDEELDTAGSRSTTKGEGSASTAATSVDGASMKAGTAPYGSESADGATLPAHGETVSEALRRFDEQRVPSPNDSAVFWPMKWSPDAAGPPSQAAVGRKGWDPTFGETATAEIPRIRVHAWRDRPVADRGTDGANPLW
ncbi:uncharacterized protein BXZ73DRAFT_75838 [Epithele typhae]|uniref:uncharacterized protein n=1 Tax=Epithele typhae TaxID=378194 RepID=UPI002007C8F4|nr:uncharacterized protein BXZ73DRAFT_75838 [Epithele typhae]KAH9939634.1 hypothetical protein BXZ73DRAFT_75838 [Epithele typhae]